MDLRKQNYLMKSFACLALLLGAGGLSSCDWAQAQTITPPQAQIDQNIPLVLHGNLRQSAAIWGKTEPNAEIDAAGIKTKADAEGYFVFGLDRDAPETAVIIVTPPDGRSISRSFHIAARHYNVSVVNGLPSATVNPPPEAMAKIQRDSVGL